MSLLDAMLMDAYRMNVWIAIRTDGVAGSGTQNDPYDGSTQAKFDALMNALPMAVSSITRSGTTATVTAINHGFANGNQVFMAGATGSDAQYYNGTFSISNVTANTFQYTMTGTPTGSATGTISCRLSQTGGPVVRLPVNPPIAVRLGPGTFKTNGYADGVSGGWQPRPGMKIMGSGADVTVLQLAGNSTNAHFYAIGHAVSPGGLPNLMDYFELSDLTIDCNLAAFSGTSAACGAVRVMGNHAKVRRIKTINWGTKSTTRPCFVLSVVTSSDLVTVEDCGIEECLAINPASSSNTGPITVLHAGGTESPPATPLAYGIGPYIRNCFADAGEASPFTPEIRGLSMAWCKAGIIEGNQAHNMTYGTFQQAAIAQDIVIRNNWFKNVNKGVFLGNLGTASGSGSLTKAGSLATVTIASGHNLSVGDVALLNTSGAYNGAAVTVLASGFTTTAFQFNTSNSATSDTVTSVQRACGVGNLMIESNVVELATAVSGELIGLHARDFWATQDANYPAYLYAKVTVRDNKLRYVDGQFGSYAGYATQLNSVANLLVRNSVVESSPANPLRNVRCGSVAYFNNLTPAGVLIQGLNQNNSSSYEELSTVTEFALVMSLLNRKT